jgi:hypothetical protein
MYKTAYSLADLADSRRQKTGWSNGSAKADAANLADKDRYHTIEICSSCCLLFICGNLRYLRETMSFTVIGLISAIRLLKDIEKK